MNKSKPIVIANWKLNGDNLLLANALSSLLTADKNEKLNDVDVAICPPYIYLRELSSYIKNSAISLGAQDVSLYESGSFTGNISAGMLSDAGCDLCIVGHSERRTYHGETNADCQVKISHLLSQNILPVLCIGEEQTEYDAGLTKQVIKSQLSEALQGIEFTQGQSLCVAYEPIYAIGTNKAATPEDVQMVHAYIRTVLNELLDEAVAASISIIYGGSVNKDNAHLFVEQPDVQGLLVGKASLDPEHFLAICEAVK
jgi:triosephosphate isomerase